jgi:hypothetical protein
MSMNATTITDQTPNITTCAVCGHACAHAAPTVTRTGGVKYCSTCPECEADLEEMATVTHVTLPRALVADDGVTA